MAERNPAESRKILLDFADRLIARSVHTGSCRRPARVARVARPRPSGATVCQNDTVVVSVTSRGSPTATIRLLLLDG